MLKQQQQRELTDLDTSILAVATQAEHLVAKYQETSRRQKAMVSRCSLLHICIGSILISVKTEFKMSRKDDIPPLNEQISKQ